MSEFYKQVAAIQQKVKAPKGRTNTFGKYQYRAFEDIAEAVKPHLGDLILVVDDEIVLVGDRYYVKSTASITNGTEMVVATGYAREAADKKGMDDSQLTGSTSSYARKFALSALLLLDDNEDADAQEPAAPVKQKITDARFNKAIEAIKKGEYTVEQMNAGFDLTPNQQAILSGVEL